MFTRQGVIIRCPPGCVPFASSEGHISGCPSGQTLATRAQALRRLCSCFPASSNCTTDARAILLLREEPKFCQHLHSSRKIVQNLLNRCSGGLRSDGIRPPAACFFSLIGFDRGLANLFCVCADSVHVPDVVPSLL